MREAWITWNAHEPPFTLNLSKGVELIRLFRAKHGPGSCFDRLSTNGSTAPERFLVITMRQLSSYRDIYAVVARIPRGCVATYGQVARLAGLPRRARFVGYALSALTDKSIPWHRVVNARGEISLRSDGDEGAELQRLRLEGEGVVFDPHGRIDLRRYQWDPALHLDPESVHD